MAERRSKSGLIRVAVELDVTRHWFRRAMAGVVRYANATGDWQLYTESPVGLSLLRRDDAARFDGAIVPAYGRSVWPARTPSVYVGSAPDPPFGPSFSPDNARTCELAAEHLAGTGFAHFGFLGVAGTTWSRDRGRLFAEALGRRGRSCTPFHLPPRTRSTYSRYVDLLIGWVGRLPLPCAVLGADDELAGLLVTAARECGVRVPHELAVLGITNDDLWCRSVAPPLSSIALPTEQIGWSAAEHLDRLIRGRVPYRRQVHRFAPTGVVARLSTDVVNYPTPIVNEAVLILRARVAREALTVQQIARELRVSRQYLSRQFEQEVGVGLKEQIDRTRIELLKSSLRGGRLRVKQITTRMGFSDPSQLNRFCHRMLGRSPRTLLRADAGPDDVTADDE